MLGVVLCLPHAAAVQRARRVHRVLKAPDTPMAVAAGLATEKANKPLERDVEPAKKTVDVHALPFSASYSTRLTGAFDRQQSSRLHRQMSFPARYPRMKPRVVQMRHPITATCVTVSIVEPPLAGYCRSAPKPEVGCCASVSCRHALPSQLLRSLRHPFIVLASV